MKVFDKHTLAELLNKYISYLSVNEIKELIEIPPAEINFTYAFPCFRLAKQEKKAPNKIAESLIEKIEKTDYLEEIESVGGYLNFRIKNSIVLENIFQSKEDYGKIRNVLEKNSFQKFKIVIEYPSPNTNKPLHLGHIRNMLIGSTISRILKYIGHDVFQVNLNNDRGIHICKSILAYNKWGNNSQPNKKSDHFVGDYYIIYSQKEQENQDIITEVEELLRKWEHEDPPTISLWKKMNKWALDGFNQTYEKFGITFDKQYFESKFYKKGKKIIQDGLKNKIFEEREDGTIIAPLKERFDLPDKVLLRSDGTSIYITQDIYLARLKKQDFHPDLSIFVVGNEQDLYFKQLFAVLDLLEFKENKYHLSYGMIYLPEGKMKSREGTVVDADDLIEKMENLAYKEVSERYPDLSESEKKKRANIIGMSALRFFILKFNPKSDFVFNPEESISFEGETGPYIQYCYARIESIISKSEQGISFNINFDILNHEKELNLIKYMNYFPEIIEQTVNTYGLHLIPQYLLTLCQAFNSFYTACKVISEDKELEKARLLLIRSVQIIIKVGLNLLGIETLEEM